MVLICFAASIATFLSCLKEPALPEVTTNDVSNIKTQSASTSGNVIDDGGAEVDVRGVCFGTATDPIITGSRTFDDKGTGSFTSIITGLTPETYYHVRAYATNRVGTAYGNEIHFTTSPIDVPAITTTILQSSIGWTGAEAGGNITYDGGASVIESGVCWAITENPTTRNNKVPSGEGTGSFTCGIYFLQPETVYHVRAYATNFLGIAYGGDVTFSTRYKPVVTTAAVTKFTQTIATIGGNVIWTNGSNVIERGICYGAAPDPTIEGTHIVGEIQSLPGFGKFTCNLTDLTPGTHYHVRAYVIVLWLGSGEEIMVYGNEVTFTTSQ